MSANELAALEGLLSRMRDTYEELSKLHAGVSLLHLEAAVASLESHLRRQKLAA